MSTTAPGQRSNPVLVRLNEIVEPLEDLYRDLHSHPELSTQEHRTAEKAADQSRRTRPGRGCWSRNAATKAAPTA